MPGLDLAVPTPGSLENRRLQSEGGNHLKRSLSWTMAGIIALCVARRLLRMTKWLGVALVCAGTGSAHAQLDPSPDWTFAATGDSIITRDIRPFNDPLFTRWVDIVRSADAAFTNLECQVFRMSEFTGWPAANHGGGYERGEPEVAHALKWAGFDMISRANNHSGDYGIEGMLATNRTLDEIGLVHAGVDRNLGLASAPAYLETAKGRIALISFATTFNDSSRAGAVRQDVQGRPGLNPMRLKTTHQLSLAEMDAMVDLAQEMNAFDYRDSEGRVRMFGSWFAEGDENGKQVKPDPHDRERILRNINGAARQADFVVVTVHAHETGETRDDPPDFLIEMAHRSIDEGATMFIVHGPHRLRGVEIYKNRPIFYSLGDFIFQYETTSPQGQDIYDDFGVRDPSALEGDLYDPEGQGDAYSLNPENAEWWDGVVVFAEFNGPDVWKLTFHPVELGNTPPFVSGDGRAQRGTPRIAEGERARSIIEQIAKTSKPFGTTVRFSNGVGIWSASNNRN